MRKVLWTAAVLALCSAPAAAQQVEKSPFSAAPAVTADVPEPRSEPASEARTPSLRVTPEQIDATVRTVAAERGESRQQLGTNFWYTVAAVALGIVIAALLLD